MVTDQGGHVGQTGGHMATDRTCQWRCLNDSLTATRQARSAFANVYPAYLGHVWRVYLAMPARLTFRLALRVYRCSPRQSPPDQVLARRRQPSIGPGCDQPLWGSGSPDAFNPFKDDHLDQLAMIKLGHVNSLWPGQWEFATFGQFNLARLGQARRRSIS